MSQINVNIDIPLKKRVCLMKKRVLALLAALCLTAGTAAAFSDVHESDWYSDEVAYVAQTGLMKGVSGDLFAPDWAVSRGTVVTVLYRLADSPTVTTTVSFSDVAAGSWYFDGVAWAQAAGVAAGYENGDFGPDDNVTREQLAVFLERYAKYKDLEIASGVVGGYNDTDRISAWALDGMKHAVGAGLITGKDGNLLDPKGLATRAQLAAVLQRMNTPVQG